MENYQGIKMDADRFYRVKSIRWRWLMCLGSTGMLCMIWRKVWHMEQFFRN